MSRNFLIFASILFAAFLGLSFLQVAKMHDPAHDALHGEIVYEFELPKTAIASLNLEDSSTSIAERLAQADAELGPKVAARCRTCHAFEKDGAHRIGPALWNVVGRDIASGVGYNYSSALSDIEGSWTAEALDGFLLKPRVWVPGTKMGFAGLGDATERANLIAWMYQQADMPLPLPQPAPSDN